MAATTDAAHGQAKAHPYHLVNPSPWPLLSTIAAFILVLGLLMVMHDGPMAYWVLGAGVLAVVGCMIGWWREVLREGGQGDHTDAVSRGLRIGMALFIVSEVFFFVAFFWAYLWAALMPNEAIGYTWPPPGIVTVPAFDIPFFNTMLLLLSGATLTWAHHAILEGDQKTGFRALLLTIGLGFLFLGFQIYEYFHAEFALWDGIYGSTFYMATGFHGFHVFVGATFLTVCTVRAYQLAFSPDKHVGLEAAAWYWHFVDVVWLFLFILVYVWGSA